MSPSSSPGFCARRLYSVLRDRRARRLLTVTALGNAIKSDHSIIRRIAELAKFPDLRLSAYNTRLVALVLHEKQVPFEFIPIDATTAEHKSAEYLKKQPFGQVPCIDDDVFILYESKAICYYIAAKYPDQGTPLLPTELKANALLHQAMAVEQSHFREHVSKAMFEIFVKPYIGLTPDKDVFEQHASDLGRKLDVYDQILGKQKYLAGDEITLVDLYHLPPGSFFAKAGSNIMESRPNVDRWFKALSSRAAWLTVKDHDDIKSTYL